MRMSSAGAVKSDTVKSDKSKKSNKISRLKQLNGRERALRSFNDSPDFLKSKMLNKIVKEIQETELTNGSQENDHSMKGEDEEERQEGEWTADQNKPNSKNQLMSGPLNV